MIQQDIECEGWQRNLVGLFCAQTLIMVAFTFFYPFFPLYVKTMGVQGDVAAAQWSGLVAAAGAVSATFAQPFWGHLSDRRGRKPIIVLLMIGCAITTIAMGLVSSPEQLLVARFFQGVMAGAFAACTALAATSTPRRQLGFALGALQVGVFLGVSIGPFIGGVIADLWGYREAFYAAGVLMFVSAITVFGLVRETFTPPVPGEHTQSFWGQNRALLAIAIFPVLTLIIFLIQFAGTIVSPMLSLFIAELTGDANAATAAGVLFAGAGVASAISALAVGRMIDRINPAVVVPVCLVGAALTHFPQAFVDQFWQLLVLRIALGLFVGGLMPAVNTLVVRAVSPERRGAAFGITNGAMSAANAVGPMFGAASVTYWGMRSVFVLTGVLFALAYGWVVFAFRRHAKALANQLEEP